MPGFAVGSEGFLIIRQVFGEQIWPTFQVVPAFFGQLFSGWRTGKTIKVQERTEQDHFKGPCHGGFLNGVSEKITMVTQYSGFVVRYVLLIGNKLKPAIVLLTNPAKGHLNFIQVMVELGGGWAIVEQGF